MTSNMTQDEIIEMARQAGCIPRRHPEYWEDVQVFATPDVLVTFAKLVEERTAAKEREACVKTLLDLPRTQWSHRTVSELAEVIRARKTNE